MQLRHMPELKDAIKILEKWNKELKPAGAEVIMPYMRKIPKDRNKNLAKGRKKFQDILAKTAST